MSKRAKFDENFERYIRRLINDPRFMALAEGLGIIKKRRDANSKRKKALQDARESSR